MDVAFSSLHLRSTNLMTTSQVEMVFGETKSAHLSRLTSDTVKLSVICMVHTIIGDEYKSHVH
jgi:hypothetical protein